MLYESGMDFDGSLINMIMTAADSPMLPLNDTPYQTKQNWLKSGNVAKIGLGLGIGSTIGNFFTTRKAEKEFYRVQDANRKAAIKNYLYQTRAINNRYAEEMEANAISQQEIQIKNMQAKATAQASSASSGVSGNSITDLYRDYDRATAASKYIAARNLHLKGLQYGDEVQALRAKAINEINTNSMTYSNNAWGNLLGGLGQVLTGYAQADYRQERLLKGV